MTIPHSRSFSDRRLHRFGLPVILLCLASLLAYSCGNGEGSQAGGETGVSIYADKGVWVELTLSGNASGDSLLYRDGIPVELIVEWENCISSMSAMLVPGCGSTAADRMEYLSGGDVKNLDTSLVYPRGGQEPFPVVMYVRGDSSVVERVWNRGAREMAILQVKCRNTSLNILLASISGILSTAELSGPGQGFARSVYLSDRTRSQIVQEVNSDVAVPPDITHHIQLMLDPANRGMEVTDTVMIDFTTTLSDSGIRMFVPRSDDGSSFEALRGSIISNGDSALCISDSSRIFSGVYSGSWTGFNSSSSDSITTDGLRIDRSMSFQCGMWFYPGCDIPSSYALDISIPEMLGCDVYSPMNETGRVVQDSIVTVSYGSPSGGVRGPLAWAAGGFSKHYIADGRSMFICSESDSMFVPMMSTAEDIAEVMWRYLGYDGGRLDMIVVNVLDLPVLIRGPGCIFISRDMLRSVSGYGNWADSISAGRSVPATGVVFETARAFLAGSTYLSRNLRDVLAAWSVFRFMSSQDPSSAPVLLSALRKYYLYTTEMQGGLEYAIADPRIDSSELYDPVILGKAPMVIEFLYQEIPAFGRAIPRALGNLRHSGDSFGRLFSAMGFSESSSYGEMYLQWLYSPGLPIIQVVWADSPDVLHLKVTQYQPGQDFPLGSAFNSIVVLTDNGSYDVDLVQGSSRGFYSADLSGIPDAVRSVMIDPSQLLPADIVYRHSTDSMNGI